VEEYSILIWFIENKDSYSFKYIFRLV
jgi:hypothetical protein